MIERKDGVDAELPRAVRKGLPATADVVDGIARKIANVGNATVPTHGHGRRMFANQNASHVRIAGDFVRQSSKGRGQSIMREARDRRRSRGLPGSLPSFHVR